MAVKSIDAKMLAKMFLAGAQNLENKKEWKLVRWVLKNYKKPSRTHTKPKVDIFKNLKIDILWLDWVLKKKEGK